MADDPPITSESAAEIVRRSASNLAFALAVLPREKRKDMEIFYAFCRIVDDLADDPDIPQIDRQKGLDHWRELVSGDRPPNPKGIESEFTGLKEKYQLSPTLLLEIIDGCAMDLDPTLRFETRDDLKSYCHHVASAVGLISIEIFGYQNQDCRIYAEQLGYALQWTNILRDIAEDADENRLYLPIRDLESFGLSENDILSRKAADNPKFRDFMSDQTEIARTFYNEATRHLPAEDRSTMRSPELMRRIYFDILKKMEKDNYRVFEKRYRLSKVRMLTEFLRAKYHA